MCHLKVFVTLGLELSQTPDNHISNVHTVFHTETVFLFNSSSILRFVNLHKIKPSPMFIFLNK